MAIEVKMDMTAGDGRAIDTMHDIIEMRRKELGETSAQACVAMTIGILKSLRAGTKIAKTSAHISVTNTDDRYTPSWSQQGKGKPMRVLRAGKDGPQVAPEKVVWKVGPYVRGEVVHSYEVIDTIAEDKQVKYIFVTKGSKSEATKYARERHKRWVMKYRGLAKVALGLAMHAVSSKQNPSVGNVSQEAQTLGMKVTSANITDTGIDSGHVNVHVEDNLNYASLALKQGEGYVETAVQRALNSAVGYLNKRLAKRGIEDKLDAPFPEVKA